MSSNLSTIVFLALMVAAFYLLILRPQRKRQQAQQQTMSSLTPGTRVMLTSGLFGTVVSVGSRQAVLEVSPGVELTVLKQAIARVTTAADEDTEGDLEEPEAIDPDPLRADLIDRPGDRPGEPPAPSAGVGETSPRPTKE